MQEKDTVLEVKNLYKLFGPYVSPSKPTARRMW